MEQLNGIFEDPESNPIAEGNLITSSGTSVPVRISVSHQSEKLCWYIENRQEIHKLKDKIDTLGSLPREYGHDINNLLTVILSATQMIQFDLEEESPIHEDLEDIIIASNRAAAKTRLFMNLGSKLVTKQQTFSIDSLIEDSSSLLRDILGKGSTLQIDLQAEQAKIHAPRISVQASISHLFAHARITRPGGNFILETRLTYIDGLFANQVSGVADGTYVIVTLRDEEFPMTDVMLNIGDYFEPDEADALSLAWEGVSRAKGSIIQRQDNYKNFCVSLYFPEITDFIKLETG